MVIKHKYWVVLLLALFCVSASAQSQPKVKTRILFLLDASGSMYATMDKDTRINVAKRLLSKIMDSLQTAKDVEVALRVYGHISIPAKRDCKDTRLEVPFKPNNHAEIKREVNKIVPKGTTLIAYSLQQAAYDFPKQPGVRNVIVLITDGLEECQGDPCAVSEALQSNGVVLRPFIVGIGGTEDFKKAFECVGRYYDADTEADFDNVLNVVISQALNNTTVQINLLDAFSKPTETNVNMTFYDSHSGQMVYNFIHTMNEKGYPDTVAIDPIYNYRVVVHSLPAVVKDNVEIAAGKHNTIGIDVPQGTLMLKILGQTQYAKLQYIIRKEGESATLNVQDANISEKYLVGKYDIEILSVPRIIQKGIEIKQSHTTTIELPQPGRLIVIAVTKAYYADLYQMNKNELQWICKIPTENRTHNMVLQPGKYKVVYRSRAAYRSDQTFEREFTITSGAATNLTLN